MTAAASEDDSRSPLTALVTAARRGLRRDVAALEVGLDDGELFVPLARGIAGAAEGEPVALDRELEIVPHFLLDASGQRHAALFTDPAMVEPLAGALGWSTDGGELSVCSLPARIACELALSVIDESAVVGLVIDASQPSELVLGRS